MEIADHIHHLPRPDGPTLRDWFAIHAIGDLLENYKTGGFPHYLVADAYRIADECMKQRKFKSVDCDDCEDALAEGWVEEDK